MSEEKNTYSVYMHVFPNGKKYFGLTKNDPEKRWLGGQGYIHHCHAKIRNAVLKYGWINTAHIVLMTGLSCEEARVLEIHLIAEHKTTDPRFGYNTDNGGGGAGRWTPEMKKQMSVFRTGRKASAETRKKMSERRRGKVYYYPSEETKAKIGRASRGRQWSAESRAKKGEEMTKKFQDPAARLTHSLRYKTSRAVVQVDPETHKEVARFHSAREAQRVLTGWTPDRKGRPSSNISGACKRNATRPKRYRKILGFIWVYAEDFPLAEVPR